MSSFLIGSPRETRQVEKVAEKEEDMVKLIPHELMRCSFRVLLLRDHPGTRAIPQLTANQSASLTVLLERQKPSQIQDQLNGTVQTGEVIIDTGACIT